MPHLTKVYKTRVVKTVVPININIILILLYKITSSLSISVGLDIIWNLCMDLEVIQIPT